MIREDIFKRISDHRDAMDAKYGERSLPNRDRTFCMTILMEEVGEVARSILENDDENYKDELFDVCQVVVAMIEGIDD